jgi:N-acetylglucosaminyldiphosphoundecaprenol N-acetyl-beta-D-mannosaminyltransferase
MYENNTPTKDLIGVPVYFSSLDEQINQILAWAQDYQSKMVCVANVHMLIEAWRNPDFADMLRNADLVTPDGIPLVWMIKQMGVKQAERVAGMDIFQTACKKASIAQTSIFLLGSKPEVLDKICKRLKNEFPMLKIAGTQSPPFAPLSPNADMSIVQTINASGAGIVFVSLGCPKQELWMAQHRDKIKAVLIGVGGVFPIYAGVMKQAPKFMRDAGFEWLFRLTQEPVRLWGRYSSTIPIFIWLALKQIYFK